MSDSPIDGFLPDEAEDDDLAPTRAEPVHLPASAQAPDPFDEATFEDDTTQTEEAVDGRREGREVPRTQIKHALGDGADSRRDQARA